MIMMKRERSDDMDKIVYLDNGATTSLRQEVFDKMTPYFLDNYANPAGAYLIARENADAIWQARQIIGDSINASVDEIYFTSGGTESDNWAIKAVCDTMKHKGRHIITSKIEHHAVLNTCKYLERHGFEVSYIDVDKDGIVDLKQLKGMVRPDTILISIMYANNETGVIQPIDEIGKIAHDNGVIFHTDAVQAYGHIAVDVKKSGIDLLSASAHKFHGPKGTGFLYISDKLNIGAFMHGGAQERNRRAGTVNVPLVVGMGCAAKIAIDEMDSNIKKVSELRDYFFEMLKQKLPYIRLNGSFSKRLPGTLNICFGKIESELAIIMLDRKGICCSAGSACTTGATDPSHVLIAMGLSEQEARSSIRFTISDENTKSEINYTIDNVVEIINRLENF